MELPHDIINKYLVQTDSFYVKEEILFKKCVQFCKLHFENYNHSIRNDKGKYEDNANSKLGRNWQSMMRSLFLFNP